MQQRPEGTPVFVWQNSGELRSYSDAPKRGPIPIDFQRRLIYGYYASVSFADAQIDRLLDHLGETNNTIVCLWGNHGMFCKYTNYEQATRSPLILSAPGTCPKASPLPRPPNLWTSTRPSAICLVSSFGPSWKAPASCRSWTAPLAQQEERDGLRLSRSALPLCGVGAEEIP